VTASEPITALDHTSVLFDVGGQQVWALQNVSLAIGSGASLSVVGKSGSGKSTLISLLALLRRPNRGRVLVRGADVGSLSDAELSALRARHVGTVFQSFHLDGAFTAQENAMMAWHFGSDLSRRAARARARHLLELVGIADLADRRSSQMSGGERQRVAIARALFGEPALLIADEPTGNLDEDTAGVIADVLFGLPQQTGTSVVVVTHDRDLANRADARIEIAHGELQPGSRSVSGPVDASLATAEAAGAAG
jgi:ABC-type lipoprotein export system ATPase subunit